MVNYCKKITQKYQKAHFKFTNAIKKQTDTLKLVIFRSIMRVNHYESETHDHMKIYVLNANFTVL